MNSSISNSYMNNNSPNAFPTGRYGPFGYNDNNSGRQRTPSNLFPQNGGMQGSPVNRFNPLTTNAMKNMRKIIWIFRTENFHWSNIKKSLKL